MTSERCDGLEATAASMARGNGFAVASFIATLA